MYSITHNTRVKEPINKVNIFILVTLNYLDS